MATAGAVARLYPVRMSHSALLPRLFGFGKARYQFASKPKLGLWYSKKSSWSASLSKLSQGRGRCAGASCGPRATSGGPNSSGASRGTAGTLPGVAAGFGIVCFIVLGQSLALDLARVSRTHHAKRRPQCGRREILAPKRKKARVTAGLSNEGAQNWTRTSTPVRAHAPQACLSTNFNTWAGG